MATTGPLSNLQIEILKLYSTKMTEDELNELKILLANYYAEKAVKQADEIWDKYNLSNQHMEDWLNED